MTAKLPAWSLRLAATVALASGCTATRSSVPPAVSYKTISGKPAVVTTDGATSEDSVDPADSVKPGYIYIPVRRSETSVTSSDASEPNIEISQADPTIPIAGPNIDPAVVQVSATSLPPASVQPPAHQTLAGHPPPMVPIGSPMPSPPEMSTLSDMEHADDYAWVRGKLIRIHSQQGYWQVRYAPFDQADRYGGRVMLLGSIPDTLTEGDIVNVTGRIVEAESRLNTTAFRVQSIELIRKGSGIYAN